MNFAIQAFLISLFTVTLFSVSMFFMGEFFRHDDRDDKAFRKELLHKLSRLVKIGEDILSVLQRTPILSKARLTLMPKTVEVGQTATAVLQGLDQFGHPMSIDSSYSVSYQASNPADVSFGTPNPDGSDVITAVAADPGDSITAVVSGGPKNVSVTSSSDVLVINAPAPVLTSVNLVLQ